MKNTVKITSGSLKGRQITTPGGKTHPMGERERLALFNMIVDYVPGRLVLDAFSGSGALGIETISRGAKHVIFIDNDSKATATLKNNLSVLGVGLDRAEVIKGDIYKLFVEAPNQFDLVLADPPYDNYDPVKIQILTRAVMKPGGILVLSHPGEAPEMPGLIPIKSRSYAGATISIYTA